VRLLRAEAALESETVRGSARRGSARAGASPPPARARTPGVRVGDARAGRGRQRERIDVLAVPIHREVEVRPGREPVVPT
jgi:hypothetical protein